MPVMLWHLYCFVNNRVNNQTYKKTFKKSINMIILCVGLHPIHSSNLQKENQPQHLAIEEGFFKFIFVNCQIFESMKWFDEVWGQADI